MCESARAFFFLFCFFFVSSLGEKHSWRRESAKSSPRRFLHLKIYSDALSLLYSRPSHHPKHTTLLSRAIVVAGVYVLLPGSSCPPCGYHFEIPKTHEGKAVLVQVFSRKKSIRWNHVLLSSSDN
ncbi:MAG: hypothetical protein J3R72DRAFT_452786 [Linnemannia gamsii]|nr:MAG: hypothetical protein J3R72DRAFT_452786 [Linnemannia gamsii]